MDFITSENINAYSHLILLGSIILFLFGLFLFQFLFPSFKLGSNLDKAIKLISLQPNGAVIDIALIAIEMQKLTPKLGHCWLEFAQTLHKQTAPDEMGQERVVCWRSTVPAEVFFNVETLIAVELKTEYFKHQPGILTGIGIIGTFIGLLRGLSNFSVSSNPELVRLSLDTLIHGVIEAFLVSASAITLAMLTTFSEKLIVTRHIKQVEELCQLLDSLFEGGAGEEYLSRLVKASESSATQTAQLKDALVADLKTMLSEMISQQTVTITENFATTTAQSSEIVANAISESLSEPMQNIANAVNTATGNNGVAVTGALEAVIKSFTENMGKLFDEQMGDISKSLNENTQAMNLTLEKINGLPQGLEDVGKNAGTAMTEQLNVALQSMAKTQSELNESIRICIRDLSQIVITSHTENSAQLKSTVDELANKVTTLSDQLQLQAQTAANAHEVQQQELAQNTQNAMTAMNEQLAEIKTIIDNQANTSNNLQQTTQQEFAALIDNLGIQVQDLSTSATTAVNTMQSAVTAMRDVTKDNTQRMENSAGKLALAATDFASAGNSVSSVIRQADTVTANMATTATSLNTTASTVQTALSDYKSAGKELSAMVEALKATIDTAKQEAAVTQSLVDQIKQSAEQLLQAQSSVDEIFRLVCDELTRAHGVFADNVVNGLRNANTAYQQELTNAVNYLKTAIQDLGDVFDNIPGRR